MNSVKNIDENFFILEGEVNYYEVVNEDNIEKSVNLTEFFINEDELNFLFNNYICESK